MTPAPEKLRALFTQLGTQTGAVVDAGLDIDLAGGTSEAWDGLLKTWGVAAMGEDARFAAAKADKMVQGAPIAEAKACIDAAVKAAGAQWELMSADLPQAQRDQVRGALVSLAEEAIKQYRQRACTRKKGMFVHAKEAAQQHGWNAYLGSKGYVLHCVSCGAPRLGSDLTCAFCGGRVGA